MDAIHLAEQHLRPYDNVHGATTLPLFYACFAAADLVQLSFMLLPVTAIFTVLRMTSVGLFPLKNLWDDLVDSSPHLLGILWLYAVGFAVKRLLPGLIAGLKKAVRWLGF